MTYTDCIKKPTKEDVFLLMCSTTACVMNYHTDLIPSTAMAEHFKCSRYRIKKILKELVEDGLVKSGYESCYSSWTEQYYIVRGFRLTKAGRNTETYRSAEENDRKLIDEVFGGVAS